MKSASLVVLLSALVVPGTSIAATQVGSAPCKISATSAGNSYAPAFSADGRHVAFVSHANNLVTNDDRAPHLDLFVRDLAAGNIALVSVSTNGFGGANDNVGLYTLSSNAQVIAFETLANNLASGDTNRLRDIYVRDLVSGTTRLITPGANGPSSNPLVSEDGQRVIFESLASNLVTNDFNGTNDIFIHDLTTGVTELVTLNAAGTASPDGTSHSPSISADGLTVAFVSHATNLVDGVTNTLGEVYGRKIVEGATLWALGSHVINPFLGIAGYNPSHPVLSADGRFVAFKTASGGVMRFDLSRETNTVVRYFEFSANPPRSNAFVFYDNPRYVKFPTSDSSRTVAFSRDGRYAALEYGLNVSGPFYSARVDFEEFVDVAVSGAASYTTNRVPVTVLLSTNRILPAGTSATGRPSSVAGSVLMTASGARVALLTGAQVNSVQNDLVGSPSGIFVWEESTGEARLISTNRPGLVGANLAASAPAISHDGSRIAWESPDGEVVENDLNRAWDVFVRNVDTGETTLVSAPHHEMPAVSGLALSGLGRTVGTFSADGSRIALLTLDNTLVSNDTNRLPDAVVRDLVAGVSLDLSRSVFSNLNGTIASLPVSNAAVFPVLSASGRFAAFATEALGVGSTNRQIFWRDLEAPTNRLVAEGTASSRTLVSPPALSSDGRFFAYSGQGNPRFVDINNVDDIYVARIRVDSGVVPDCLPDAASYPPPIASTAWDSRDTANGASVEPVFAPDDGTILFRSLARNLTEVVLGPQAAYQLYRRAIWPTNVFDTGCMRMVESFAYGPTRLMSYSTVASLAPDGSSTETPLPGGGSSPRFSGDSAFATFESATNSIFRHDLRNDYVQTVSEVDGMSLTNRAWLTNVLVCTACANASLNLNGRLVAYETRPALGGITNILLKDIESGAVELVSIPMAGTNANGSAFAPLLSHDARFVVFTSRASDLVSGDNNRATDVFVRDRWTATTHCLSRNIAGTGTGNRVSSNPVLAANGRTVAFQSFANDLVAGDYNDTRDVFVVTLGGPDNDADGMEDDWEAAYFNSLARDGSGDFDNDGASDGDEFRAGTNPSNDASILRVLRLTTGTAGQGIDAARRTVITWSAVPGRRYRVELTEALGQPWQPLGAEVVATTLTPSVVHEQDSSWVLNKREVFYRVTLVQ